MSEFDPAVPLTMAKFKTVHGFNLAAGTALAITEEPSRAGEVTEPMAKRLFLSGTAIPTVDFRPTPVETADQEKAREAAAALADATVETTAPDGSTELVDEGVVPPADLLTWQADDAEAGKQAGQAVTRADLILIAGREEVVIETDDNKPAIIRKIVEARAAKAAVV